MRRTFALPRHLLAGWRRFHRADPIAGVASLLLLALVLIGLAAPFLPLPRPDQIGAGTRLGAPSWELLLGADNLGRDMLARVLQGLRITFLLSSAAVLVSALVGVVIGLLAAYFRGWVDELATRLADVVFSFPAVLMGLMITAILGPGPLSVVCAIVLVTLPPMVRMVRAAALQVARADFVTIAALSGASMPRRLLVHLLPNVAVAVVAQTAFSISIGMLVESALSFLGLGSQPPDASLGSLLREGSTYLTAAPWLVFGPAAFLVLAIFSVNLVGEGLRHVVDPLNPRSLKD